MGTVDRNVDSSRVSDEETESPGGSSPSMDLAKERTRLARHRSHLANERTHLAYLRTSVALAGFGITLNWFAIYLIQSSKATGADAGAGTLRDVKHVGLSMVILGIATASWALFRYARASRDIEQGTRHRDWRAVATTTIAFIVLGAGVTVWLFVD